MRRFVWARPLSHMKPHTINIELQLLIVLVCLECVLPHIVQYRAACGGAELLPGDLSLS